MAMKMLREGAKGGLGKFILVGFMALAVGGLVLMDMGGFFRGGITSTDVAKIGKQTVNIQNFDRYARQTLRQIGISADEAYKMGYINQLLNNQVRTRIINKAAYDHDIFVSDEHVAKHIKTLIMPMVTPQMNAKSVMSQILANQGMSEEQFVASIRQDMTTSLFTGAINAGVSAVSDDLARDIYNLEKQRRSFSYVAFMDSDVTDDMKPDDGKLMELFEATKDSYAAPETRMLQIVTIDSETLKSTLDISNEQLVDAYEDNIEYYQTPKTWTLDQATLPTQDQAKAVYNAVKNGASVKSAVKDVTGNTSAYLNKADFKEAKLIDAIKEPVMAANGKTTLEPINSPLGWYVVNVMTINPASTKSFDSVKSDLRSELADTMLLDQLYDMAGTVDDLFASGANVEDVADQVDVTVTNLPSMTRTGQTPQGQDALSDMAEMRDTIIDDGFSLLEGESSAVHETGNGKFIAVHVKQVNEKSYPTFDQVRPQIQQKWVTDNKRLANRMRADGMIETLGDKPLSSIGTLTSASNITRTDKPSAPLMTRSIMNVFEAPLNTPFVVDIDGGIAIAKVTGITWPDTADEKEITALKTALSKQQQEEALSLYVQKKSDEYGVKINQKLLDQVYGGDDSDS